ncbi:double-strand break repair protein AddB [Glacieibacterium sp.]|uniref:double-strand break repair protein AddB n=1 Tax=Glacieibacterium sp. TaxID=2860237 RepID=UPI003B00D57B
MPPHVAFVDALAAGLLERTGGEPLALARARVLLPNRRAVRALTDAFVRLSGSGGLLLPRMTPIGDVDEDEATGAFATEMSDALDLPPAMVPCERRLLLAQLVRNGSRRRGDTVTAVEALRLADALAKALDALTSEEIEADALESLDLAGLATHFEATLVHFRAVRDNWPAVLASLGVSDAATRYNRVVDALAVRWQAEPPAGLVVAAGLTGVSPPVARLLGVVARLPQGMVVLPGVDTVMPDAEWDAIRCDQDADCTHPQHAFKRLLDRMSVGRGEVADWGSITEGDGPAARSLAVARAMSLPAFTTDWREPLDPAAFAGVRTLEAATPEEEAQAVALALRRALDTLGRTAALVTPDRGLARRVAAHLARWDIDIDDSAGQPLRSTPPGTLFLALAEAAAQHFAPVALLAVLKHPLVRRGDERLTWLDRVRQLDLDLRGIRPAPGLAGVAERVAEHDTPKERTPRKLPLAPWWAAVAEILQPLTELFGARDLDLATVVAALRDAGEALAGDELWRGPAGRALAEIVGALTTYGHHLQPFEPDDAPPLLGSFLGSVPVREAYGKHPRLAIYGTLEARLQRADLTILGGLNEGMWPSRAAPDPWLAPQVRKQLGLDGIDRAVGLAAHDFVQGLGGGEVLLTRARRDDASPAVPSRFWLRLRALAGEAIAADSELLELARALDRPATVTPAERPRPLPPVARRPRRISVTAAERLKADPFSFYASRMLRLDALSPLDEDPGAAERGTDLHGVLEAWTKSGGEPEDLQALADAMLADKWSNHPLMGALWAPRIRRALEWVVEQTGEWEAAGWGDSVAEAGGLLELPSGITLTGKADRIDRNAAGELAIIDYKTGTVPSFAQVDGGFALQMGLLALMAERGKLGPAATVGAVRYWKLGGGKVAGKVTNPLERMRKEFISAHDHVAATLVRFDALCEAYLLGSEPFTAKLHPDHAARYSDFDHLARVAEWQARPRTMK